MNPCTRREFLLRSTLSVGVMTAAANSAPQPNRWRRGLGLNGFMSSSSRYGKSYPIEDVLAFARDTGFDGIELVDGWPNGPYPTSDSDLADLKDRYERHELQIYTLQTGGPDSYAADPNRRKEWLAKFRSYVDLGKRLGCDFIGNWPGGDMAGNATVEQAIENLSSSYREAARIASDAGMFLSFEIEPPFIFNTPGHLTAILQSVDHRACKTNYDPSHFDLMWQSRGKPEEMLAHVGVHHIGHVHLTDTDGTLFAGTSRHLACGEGHCDIEASLKTLWDGGYAGWIMVDAWMIEDVYHAARKGIEAIESAERSLTTNSA